MADNKYILGGAAELLQTSVNLHSQNFDDDPMARWMCQNLTDKQRHQFLREHYFPRVLHIGALGGAIFDEVYTPGSSQPECPSSGAIWLPPPAKLTSVRAWIKARLHRMFFAVGVRATKRMLWDYQRQVEKCKAKYARWPDGSKIKEYYYMAWISTLEEARGKGLTSDLIKRFQERAAAENRPIWSETSTEKALRVYQKAGFRVVHKLVFGQGTHDEKGLPKEGGEGVPAWMILWIPPQAAEK